MWHCTICAADLTDDQVVQGVGVWKDVPVHLHDSGPRHADLAIHPVRQGTRYARAWTPAIALPLHLRAPVLAAAPAPAPPHVQDPNGAVVWTDVSMWQPATYSQAYGRWFAAYKVTQSTTSVDPKCAANTNYCHSVAGLTNALIGHCGYHVWYPGNEAAQAAFFFANAKIDDFFVAMIDCETWGGAIRGDHSDQLNALALDMAAVVGQARVLPYGNWGDLSQLWPRMLPWLRANIGIASYSSVAPSQPHLFWQYTDGDPKYPYPATFPIATAPFGNCDHNMYPGTVTQLQTRFGFGFPPNLIGVPEMAFQVVECNDNGPRQAAGIYAAGPGVRVHIPNTGFTPYYLNSSYCDNPGNPSSNPALMPQNDPSVTNPRTIITLGPQLWDVLLAISGEPNSAAPTSLDNSSSSASAPVDIAALVAALAPALTTSLTAAIAGLLPDITPAAIAGLITTALAPLPQQIAAELGAVITAGVASQRQPNPGT